MILHLKKKKKHLLRHNILLETRLGMRNSAEGWCIRRTQDSGEGTRKKIRGASKGKQSERTAYYCTWNQG